MKLTSENVEKVFRSCLFEDNEEQIDIVNSAGVVIDAEFKKQKLEENKENIIAMLDQLPDDFNQELGGGMHFTNAAYRNDNYLWGEHCHVDFLICLGIAVGYVRFCLAREFWAVLPQKLPYFVTGKIN